MGEGEKELQSSNGWVNKFKKNLISRGILVMERMHVESIEKKQPTHMLVHAHNVLPQMILVY